jgi:hypothetical protein
MMFKKERRSVVLIAFGLVIVAIVIIFAPIIPVESTLPQTRTRPLHYNAQYYNQSSIPIFVNVTNTDSVGGIFSVTLFLMEGKPAVGGVEFETKETTTQSLFIDSGATEKFSSPEEWTTIQSMYTFSYTVKTPSTQENYNVTKTEYKSLISIIGNP